MKISRFASLSLVAALFACGEAPGLDPQSITEFLQVAGFDTAPTARQRTQGTFYDPVHAPLGTRRKLLPQEELFVAARNLEVGTTASSAAIHGMLLNDLNPDVGLGELGRVDEPSESSWRTSSALVDMDQRFIENYKPLHGWVVADFLGNDREQLVELVHRDGVKDFRTEARLYQGDGLAISPAQNLNVENPDSGSSLLGSGNSFSNHIHFGAGDIDGNGREELIVAFRDSDSISNSEGVRLLFYEVDEGGAFLRRDESIYLSQADLPGGQVNPQGGSAGRNFWIEIACGNLDEDPDEEIVLTFNDNREELTIETVIPSRFQVFDRAFGGFESIAQGTVGDSSDGSEGGVRFSRATAIFVQIDYDIAHEVVFGGIDATVDALDEEETLDARYGLYSYDWTGSTLELTGSLEIEHEVDGTKPALIQFAFLEALDLNGDGFQELLLGNSFLRAEPNPEQQALDASPVEVNWQRIQASSGPLTLDDSLFETASGSNSGLSFGRLRSAVTSGDLDGDGREELAVVWAGPGGNTSSTLPLFVYEATEGSLPGIDETLELTVEAVPSGLLVGGEDGSDEHVTEPSLAFMDTQDDSFEIEHIAEFSQNAWMEPVLVGAAVAPPANNFGTQFLDETQTLLGPSDSNGIGAQAVAGSVTIEELGETEAPYSFEVSIESAIAVEATGIDQPDALLRELLVSLRPEFTQGPVYDSSHEVRFSTSPMEHTLIFATASLDRYRYRVTRVPSSDFDAVVDRSIALQVPRELELFAIERSQYNQIAPDQQHLVTTDIINVAPGSVGSYPSPSEWVDIHTGAEGSYPVLQMSPPYIPVILGSDASVLEELEFDEFLGPGGGAFGVQVDVASNKAQPLERFSMGTEFGSTLRIRSEAGSVWTGRVGGIGSQTEWDNQFYRWGMGVRLATLEGPGWTFPVFDYFVE